MILPKIRIFALCIFLAYNSNYQNKSLLGQKNLNGPHYVFEIGNLESVTNGAVVRLKHSLDYETQSVYQLKVIAMDRGGFGGFNQDRVNTATAAVLVKVEDVEDKKPEFIRVPSVTRVLEGVPKHTQVGIYISLHSN